MREKKKGDVSPIDKTLPMGAVRGKTIAGVVLSQGKTLPPLPEDITREASVITDADYLFKIELTKHHSLLVTEMLGAGGMGKVYRATHEFKKRGGKAERGGKAAVKLIHFDPKSLGSEPEKNRRLFCESILSEVQLVTKLNHDNIIKIFVYGETEAPGETSLVPFYAMELLEGKDLKACIKEAGRMPWKESRPLILQVCSALAAAHEYEEDGKRKPIIHNDIKPKNIVITTDSEGKPKAKVLDFGLAKALAPRKQNAPQREGLWGTPDYLSPEQASFKETDHRTDIYSVGAMMYEMLSGRPPFVFNTPNDPAELSEAIGKHLKRVLEEPPAPLAVPGADIPPEVERIIFRCLEKDPDKRYQSARELRADLLGCDGGADKADMQEGGPLSAEKTEIANMPDLIEQHRAAARGRLRKRLFYAFLGVIGAGMVSSGAIVLKNKMRGGAGDNRSRISGPADAAPKSRIAEMPLLDGRALDGGAAPDTQPAKKEHTVTLKMNIGGVRVLSDGRTLCEPSAGMECSFTLAKGTEPVALTLRKRGYMDLHVSVLPDMDKSVPVRMMPEPPKRKKPKEPKKAKHKFLIDSE